MATAAMTSGAVDMGAPLTDSALVTSANSPCYHKVANLLQSETLMVQAIKTDWNGSRVIGLAAVSELCTQPSRDGIQQPYLLLVTHKVLSCLSLMLYIFYVVNVKDQCILPVAR